MALFSTQNLRFLVRGGLLSALKAATGSLLRPMARELTIATDKLSLRVGDGSNEYTSLSVLNPVSPSFQYKTETGSTADSDPGSGLFKWNHATQSSATFLYFDDNTSGTGTDLSTFFTSLSGAPTGFIHIVLEEDRAQWQVWKWSAVTDGTGYWKFAVTLQASTASLADNLPVRVTFQALSSTVYTDENAQDAINSLISAGSHTGITWSYNDAGNALSATVTGAGSGAWTLLDAPAVVGSAATVLTSGTLSLSSYKEFLVIFIGKNATASAANLSIYFNGDTTAANYRRESATNGVFSNAADAICDSLPASENTVGRWSVVLDLDGRARVTYMGSRDSGANLSMRHHVQRWSTAANVTSITISSSVANALAVGTKFYVYGLN